MEEGERLGIEDRSYSDKAEAQPCWRCEGRRKVFQAGALVDGRGNKAPAAWVPCPACLRTER